jgi:predicted DNA binding protein
MEVQPTVYRSGAEWYRVLAFEGKDLLNLFKDLARSAKVEVVSRNTISEGSVRDTFHYLH